MKRMWNPNGLVQRHAATKAKKAKVRAILDGPEGDKIRARVERGATQFLAKRDPKWAEKIMKVVRDKRFNLSSCSNCAVGAVLGDWSEYTGTYGKVPAVKGDRMSKDSRYEGGHLGFSLPEELVLRDPDEDYWSYSEREDLYYAATEQAWVDYAREQVRK